MLLLRGSRVKTHVKVSAAGALCLRDSPIRSLSDDWLMFGHREFLEMRLCCVGEHGPRRLDEISRHAVVLLLINFKLVFTRLSADGSETLGAD
jgi:hypothetical protein